MGANEKQKLAKKVSDLKTKKPSLPVKRNAGSSSRKKEVSKNPNAIPKKVGITDVNFTNGSIIPYMNKVICGQLLNSQYRTVAKTCIINHLKRFKAYHVLNDFHRRVTSIAWHPVYPQIAAAASKGGELAWFNLNISGSKNLPGIGPGGSIVGLKFDRMDPSVVYTASITGFVKRLDIDRKSDKTLLVANPPHDWFSSLEVCYDRKLILAGDTLGFGHLTTYDGVKVWSPRKRLHRSKVSHVEFSPVEPHIFVTASVDHNVKLWDLRMVSETVLRCDPLHVFPHKKGVNSAYFSPSNGKTLLTTDQHSEVRVYKSPVWHEELIIPHPHRFFQHITPIKATWHPIEDIFMVGRYPDELFLEHDERSLDFYDGSSGDLLFKRNSPVDLIPTLRPDGTTGPFFRDDMALSNQLNMFNITGDTILSGAGTALFFWKDENVLPNYKF